MIITSDFKTVLAQQLEQAKTIWIASAMISYTGWNFVQAHLSSNVEQHYLIGTDLATDPKVFETLLDSLQINARVYQTMFTFHPKVYLIRKIDNKLTAFVGSSNTTKWGLEKNTEINFQISDPTECTKLLHWFNTLFADGYLITEKFVEDYRNRFQKTRFQAKEIESEAQILKKELAIDQRQFFTSNEHRIFEEKYHRIATEDLKRIRKDVSNKLKSLHFKIYPRFKEFGLTDLHAHHSTRELVSRHFFNPFSGNYINAMWLHYGKSYDQLQAYQEDKGKSFINNIRLQVIMHEDSIGFWLVLGREWSSVKDREHYRSQLENPKTMMEIFTSVKNLGKGYWISEVPNLETITDPKQLKIHLKKERPEKYFIVGRDINWLDPRLSTEHITETILKEFQKLYPLYKLFRHSI